MNSINDPMGQTGGLAQEMNGLNDTATELVPDPDGERRTEEALHGLERGEESARVDPRSRDGSPLPGRAPIVEGERIAEEACSHDAGWQPAVPQISNLRHEREDGAKLLEELRAVLRRYVVLPPMAAEALALWVVHTYAFTLGNVTTYIGIGSPEKRCGKTTLLRLLGKLANRAILAANISDSALFRVIEETRPTLLIDEADTFLQGRDEMRGILNAGYHREGSYVVRVSPKTDRQGHSDILEGERAPEIGEWTNENVMSASRATGFARYSCWCPKVMAAIGQLPDTLADRCIVITMQRKTASDPCERMRNLKPTELRARCARFVREQEEAIRKAQPEIPVELNDRAADIWEPLLAIADVAGGEWPELARRAALRLSSGEDEPTLLAYFLKDLRNIFVLQQVDRMLSREIVAVLNPMHSRPWEDLRRGREINEWWLGWQLRGIGIRSRGVRIGERTGKGYMLEEIEAAFQRYMPNAEQERTNLEASSSKGAQDSISEPDGLHHGLTRTNTDEAEGAAQAKPGRNPMLEVLEELVRATQGEVEDAGAPERERGGQTLNGSAPINRDPEAGRFALPAADGRQNGRDYDI